MIKLMGIHKQFGNDKVLEEVNLTLENNGIYIVLLISLVQLNRIWFTHS